MLIVGNPGVGKSTMLNGLVGYPAFKSGLNFGTGMTKSVQMVVVDGVTYVDTPGLDDVEFRDAAAKEIAEALRQDGEYQLIFVVTFEAGRVRPADVTTMKIVLDAIEGDVPFGVVVNKLSAPAIEALNEESNRRLAFASLGLSGSAPPCVFLNPFQIELFDTDDNVPPISNELEAFLRSVPAVFIPPSSVSDLKHDEYAGMVEEFTAQLSALKAEAEAQTAMWEQRIADLKEQIAWQREQYAAACASAGGSGGNGFFEALTAFAPVLFALL